MSRSNNTDVTTPVKKRFEWSGSEGKIKSYDSAKKENEWFELPFTFLVLDKLSTIAGFSDADQSGFWSNEVRNVKTDILTVRTRKGVEQEGLYADLTPTLNKGAKYAQSVYIAFYEGDELVIGNIKIYGSALGSWIDFQKDNDVYSMAVTIQSATPAKKGATKYFVPVYVAKPVSEETNKKAAIMDAELQVYLNSMLSRNGSPSEKTNYSAPANRMTPNTFATKIEDAYSGGRDEKKDGKIYDNASTPGDDLPF